MLKPSYDDVLGQPDRWLTDRQHRWLRPRGALAGTVHGLLYLVVWLAIRLMFRFSVEGREHLPKSGPFIIVISHMSPLDPQILGAALPLAVLRNSYWAGKERVVLKTWLRRKLSWYTRIMPIATDPTALAPAVKILERGDRLIWFPEGARSLDGELHDFKPGVVQLLTKCDVPVVPVYIQGAHAACPAARTFPRLRTRVIVRIGPAKSADQLGLKKTTGDRIARGLELLRESVLQLRNRSRSQGNHD